MEYVRLVKTLNEKGDIVPAETIDDPKSVEKVLYGSDNDWYTSLFRYTEDAAKYFSEKGSIGGYTGPAHCRKLFFDFDSEGDIETAKTDAAKLLGRFQKKYNVDNIVDHCRVYFSGNKGFHVEVLTNKNFSPKELKEVCSAIAEGLESFDSQIYNTTRLIRLPNTIHQKSNLYKIELFPKDLIELSIEDIKERAKVKNTEVREITPLTELSFLDQIEKTKKVATPKSVIVDDAETDLPRGLADIDFSKCPLHVPRCIYALSKGIMVPNSVDPSWEGRSRVFFRLAAYYRNQGMDKEAVHNVLKAISRLNHALYPEAEPIGKDEIWNQHVASAFNETAKQNPGGFGSSEENDLIKRYCDAAGNHTNMRCILHSKSSSSHDMVKIDSVFKSFEKFATDLDGNRVSTGLNFIDDNMDITKGTTTLIAGAAGSGKTTLCLNIIENSNRLDQHAVFFSMDMHRNLVFLKLAQKITNYNKDDILNFYKTHQTDKIDEIRDAVAAKYNKTFFDFSATMTIEQMRDKVLNIQDKHGVDVALVLVDYASRITSDHKDTYANARHNALKSTEVAEVTDAAWLYISQISRITGDASTPLRTKRVAKDSGDWEETATNVITVWRPFIGMEGEDDVMRLFLAKNRMGREIERPLWWNGAKGIIQDMSEIEYHDYKSDREEEEKEAFKSRFKK